MQRNMGPLAKGKEDFASPCTLLLTKKSACVNRKKSGNKNILLFYLFSFMTSLHVLVFIYFEVKTNKRTNKQTEFFRYKLIPLLLVFCKQPLTQLTK